MMHRNAMLAALGAAAAAAQELTTTSTHINGTAAPTGCSTSRFLDTMCFDDLDDQAGGVVLELFLFCFCFLGLAIVCDEYLVMSLETLCLRWGIREDIAGCTFMAFGSAAPEIIVNAVATLKASRESTQLGISAIIGSGMIAFMAIPACCGIFGAVDGPLLLKRRPLVRDTVAYLVGLTELCYFLQNDSKVDTMEGLIMVITYALYIVVVVVSPKIRRVCCMPAGGGKGEKLALIEKDDMLDPERAGIYKLDGEDDATNYHTADNSPVDKAVPEIVIDEVQRETRVKESGDDEDEPEFITTNGMVLAFPKDGPVALLDGVDVGNASQGVVIEMGRRYTIQFPAPRPEDVSLIRQHQPTEVALPVQGCERAASMIANHLVGRGIECTRTVAIGCEVHAQNDDTYESGVIKARDDATNTYTVEFDTASVSPATSPRALMRSPRPGPTVSNVPIDRIRPFIFRRKQIFQYPPTSRGGSAERLSPRRGGDDHGSEWGGESLYSTYTAMSLWRRHWWHTSHAESALSTPAMEGLCTHWYSPLLIFVYFWQVVFKYTIPYHEIEPETIESERQLEASVMKSGWRQRLYPVTFVISFIWVAAFSFVISTVAARWAEISGLGGGCIGLVLISLGAEIPDCIQSVTVAKRGYGSMAVSNACGSQITNIFLGLGLPWFIYNVVKDKPVLINDPDILTWFMALDLVGVLAMFMCLVGMALISAMNKALLTKQKAYFLFVLYVLVIGCVFVVNKLY